MSKKLDNVRIVTFKEDYRSKVRTEKNSDPIYRKGSKHAIHQRLVSQLKEKGAKMEVEKYDYQRAVELAKKAMAINEKNNKARDN